jgi:hypothetical protein
MDAVRELIPVDDPMRRARVTDERFELDIDVQQADGSSESFPSDLEVVHATALAKLLHRPVVLKVFRENLQLPVGALQNLAAVSDAGEISRAIQHVLAYLQAENPYFLTYRFGPKEAEAMRAGLQELLALAQWTVESGLALTVTPVRRYYSPERGEQVVQIEQGRFEGWM